MRLPVSLRMKAAREFARVREAGTSFRGGCLIVSVLPVEGQTRFKFGLVTGSKIGGAVVRNRVRRRLREVIRETQDRIKDGVHVVIIARWRAPEASLQELRSEFLRSAQKAGILVDKS